MSELVYPAFKALGDHGPTYNRLMALVAGAIRESGDREALALFGLDRDLEPLPGIDPVAVYDRVREVVNRAGREYDSPYLVDFVWNFDSEYVQQALEGRTSGKDRMRKS